LCKPKKGAKLNPIPKEHETRESHKKPKDRNSTTFARSRKKRNLQGLPLLQVPREPNHIIYALEFIKREKRDRTKWKRLTKRDFPARLQAKEGQRKRTITRCILITIKWKKTLMQSQKPKERRGVLRDRQRRDRE